jgi:DNA-binding LacI/PurR family transcriptional regulator
LRINMDFIAEKTGFSKATVSRYFKSPQLLRSETKDRIGKIVARYDYVYNAHAADFSKTRTSLIGLVIPTVQSSIYARFIDGIQSSLRSTGFTMLIAYTDYSLSEESKVLTMFQQRRVSAIIIPGIKKEMLEVLKVARKHGTAIVNTWDFQTDHDFACVGIDNRLAAFKATAYLLGLGHRRIGLIMGPYSTEQRVQNRYKGYAAALHTHGIAASADYVIETHPTLNEGKQAMERLLALDEPPTAVFAASDALAIGALKAAADMGKRVPADVSVAGFDNIDISAYISPALTTVSVPAFEMGERAAHMALALAREPAADCDCVCLATELVIRASTAPPREPGA